MRLNQHLRSCLLIPALLLALYPSANAQETYKLADKSAVGDVAQIEDEFSIDFTMKGAAEGAAPITLHLTSKESKKYLQTLLSQDAQGKTDGLRRTYTVSREVKNEGHGEQIIKAPVEGKTVIIRRKDKKVVVTSPTGTVSPEIQKSLSGVFDNDLEFLPDHAVAFGDEWEIDTKKIAQSPSFQPFKNVTMRVKLLDITSFEGHRCARMRLDVHMEGPLSEGLSMQFSVSGDSYLALDIERMIGIDLRGPVTFIGTALAPGVTLQSSEGTAHIKAMSHWQKVAGKPVAASTP